MPGGPFPARIVGVRGSANRAPRWTTGNQIVATKGTAFLFPVSAVGNPTPTLTITGSLPSGVSFADYGTGQGLIGGTPTAVATATATLTATNVQGTANQQVSVNVQDGTVVTTPVAPAITSSATVTSPEDQGLISPVTATGYPAPTFTVQTGTLPTGLTLTNYGGGAAVIAGIPTTPAVTTVTLRATNASGHADQVVTITITAVNTDIMPVITSPNALIGTVGQSIYFVVTATGSPLPSLTQTGTLPGGLTFADAGAGLGLIAGVPTTAGFSSVVLKATNAKGTAAQTLTCGIGSGTPPPTNVYVVPSSIDNTGTVDVTAALQAFINTVPNGTSSTPNIIQFRAGTYRVEGRIWLGRLAIHYPTTPVKNYIVFDGSAGTTITRSLAGAGQPDVLNCDVFTVQQGTGVVFYGLEIDGGNTTAVYRASLETQNGIRFMGAVGCEVSNCLIHHTYGDSIYMGYGQLAAGGTRLSQNIWVHDNEFHHNGRQGVSPCGINHAVVENNYFHNETRAGVDMEPIGAPASQGGPNPNVFAVYDCHLLGNRMDTIGLSVFANKGSGLCDGIVIADNYTTDTKLDTFFGASNYNDGTAGARRYNLWFMRNTFTAVQMAWPIHVQRYEGVMFKDNVIAQQARTFSPEDGSGGIAAPFVETNFCAGVTVTGNTHTSATGGQVYNSNYTTGTAISTTEPAAPDVGAAYALRSTGGWTP